jgi:hypothetical protein
MKRNKCLICESKNLTNILDLGNHPYADTFIPKNDCYKLLPVYKLSCSLCEDCGHIQTETITSPQDRYNLFDYSYTSSNSSVAKEHWKEYCKEVIKNLSIKSSDRVCEIGSNDGYLLSLFKQNNNQVLGIDASKNLVEISKSNKIPAIQSVFDAKASIEILKSEQKFNLVMANRMVILFLRCPTGKTPSTPKKLIKSTMNM